MSVSDPAAREGRAMKVLVTGGAGFIGSAVVRRLWETGHEPVVYDDLSTGDRRHLPPDVRLIEGDVRDRHAVARACHGIDAVAHLAAFVSVPASFTEAPRCRAINVDGTRHVLEAAARAGVGRVMLASTAAIYGPAPALPTREEAPPQPASPYADSTLAAERALAAATRGRDLETVALRFFNVYGPRQKPDSAYAGVVAKAMQRLTAGEPFVLFGDGLQTRDFVYVEDAARAVVAAVTRPGVAGQAINVGCGRETTVLDLIAAVGRVVGREPQLRHEPPRPGDARRSVADVGRMARLLGLRAEVGLDEGLGALRAWYHEAAHA